ncbi:MAG: NAD(P)H-hydrate dehydratase [Archaeoglobaceae archaeon]
MENMTSITGKEMMVVDTNCEYYGLSRLQLMENAGRGLAEEIVERFDSGKVIIYAGLGNNGGDAFVAARFLQNFDVKVLLMGKVSDIKSDIARRNADILKRCGVPIIEIRDSTMMQQDDSDIIIDAMLGTGVRGKLREPYATAVDLINSSNSYVLSVDVPTGLDPDSGDYYTFVKSNLTVTFHKMKPGLKKAGEVIVKSIGIPSLIEKLTGPGDVKRTYHRFSGGHKGTHGKVLVIGGGPYSGAPALTAMAAYAAGADLVNVVVPETVYDIVASFSPNLIVRKVKGEQIGVEHVEHLREVVKKFHVVVMGMGSENAGEFSQEFLKYTDKAVLDAGALIPQVPEGCECIMTPHSTEFLNTFGYKFESEKEVKKAAKSSGATILLKSVEDVISDGEKIKINRAGNAGMTVGGTGDLLAGIAGTFLSLDEPFWSASSAVYINGRAGDMLMERMGYNYTAMDMLSGIPLAIKESIDFE